MSTIENDGLEELRKHFEEGWGKKCIDYEGDCPCCLAWRWFEGAGESYLQALLKSEQQALVERLVRQAVYMRCEQCEGAHLIKSVPVDLLITAKRGL